jgi:hypothetical protein
MWCDTPLTCIQKYFGWSKSSVRCMPCDVLLKWIKHFYREVRCVKVASAVVIGLSLRTVFA